MAEILYGAIWWNLYATENEMSDVFVTSRNFNRIKMHCTVIILYARTRVTSFNLCMCITWRWSCYRRQCISFFFFLFFFFLFSFNKPGGVYVLCIYLHTRGELLLETWVFFEFVRFFMQRLTPLFVQIAVGLHSMGDPTILWYYSKSKSLLLLCNIHLQHFEDWHCASWVILIFP